MRASDIISIGDVARRTGLSVSAIRFYEAKGLIEPFRSSGGQRRFFRSDIRRLSFIRRLDGCIGCGCLSLDKCALYNPGDKVAARGTGPMLVLPDGG